MRPVVKPLVVAAVTLVAATGCNDDPGEARGTDPDTEAAAAVEPTATTAAATESESDGVLTIGVLLPQTGEGATIGIPGIAAANLAVGEVNEAGGVLDEDVRLISVDEGQTPEQAQGAIDELLNSDVDAIVGPASSLVALEFLDELVDAGVVTCSPTATSMALDDFPDDGLFFRTIASDSMAANGIAYQAQRTGVTTATVVYVDDAFGRPFAREVIDSLRERGVEVRDDTPLGPADDYQEVANVLAGSEPGTIILIADSDRGWTMLGALSEVFEEPPRIVINDAMRQPPSAEQVAALRGEFRSAIEGISPLGTPGRNEPVGPFATNSYDCVNLIALAAVAANTDESTAFAGEIAGVSSRGFGCSTFEACATALRRDRDIDYNGPRARFSIDSSGDPSVALLMLFGFNESGIAGDLGSVTPA